MDEGLVEELLTSPIGAALLAVLELDERIGDVPRSSAGVPEDVREDAVTRAAERVASMRPVALLTRAVMVADGEVSAWAGDGPLAAALALRDAPRRRDIAEAVVSRQGERLDAPLDPEAQLWWWTDYPLDDQAREPSRRRSGVVGTSRERQQVWAGAQEGWLALGDPSDRESPLERVRHVEVVNDVTQRTFDSDNFHVHEACHADFCLELVRRVTPRGGEPHSGVVNARVHDRRQAPDDVVIPRPCRGDVDERRPPAYRGSGEQPSGAQHPVRFRQRRGAADIIQVIERSEQQHRIHRRVRLVESASVTDRCVETQASCGRDVRLDDVDQGHVVTYVRHPQSVESWAAADIENPSGGWRQSGGEELAGPGRFEAAMLGSQEPSGLVVLLGVEPMKGVIHRHS